ncbi:MAG TPA: CopG family transcriptional regulator [Acidimicrobiales bacterium]|nr:CopG family transcriptional regulator [Acidimicrobiales bacterium]
MRTTLSIDDDVLFAVKERARRQKRTVGEVVSELAREALNNEHSGAKASEKKPFYGFQPFPHRGGAVSNSLIDGLREDEGV